MAGKRPERTYKAGKVQVNVWLNTGGKFESLVFQATKNYKTAGEQGEWKSTNNYTVQDLADLAVLIAEVQRDYRIKLSNNTDNSNTTDDIPF